MEEELNQIFVTRPKHQLDLYPVEYRWEFTRRHPYYLGFWQEASRFYTNPHDDVQNNRVTSLAAVHALAAIGVFGQPVPPATPFSELHEGDPTFLCGSLQPVTVRYLAHGMLGQLSPEALRFLAQAFLDFAMARTNTSLDIEARRTIFKAVQLGLHNHKHPDFQKTFDIPLFLMHLNASQETIKEDANRQARLWKKKKGQDSPKIHTQKFTEYLQVWDYFEGWIDGVYNLKRETCFKAIAKQVNASVSTVHDRYRRAFELVVGQPFSPLLWCRTVGRFKVETMQGNTATLLARYTRRRLTPDRVGGQISASPVKPPLTGMTDLVAKTTVSYDDPSGVRDLATDIYHLIAAGHSDAQIVAELELVHPDAMELVRYLRGKNVDLEPLSDSRQD